jgi:hypothetical protein
MWISHKNTFLALCRDDHHPAMIGVRARRKQDILALFPTAKVQHTPRNDYQYRAFVPEQEAAQVIAREVMAIDYRRFKPEVNDRALHDSYMRCWRGMLDIQEPGTGGIYNNR